jgi:hypothetical protein
MRQAGGAADAGGLMVPVVNAPTLLKMWDAVFPPEVRCMIEESAVPRPGEPKPKYVMTVDSAGASLGDGRLRIDRGADGLKISRLVLPPGYGSGLAGKPQPVLFKWGKGLATYRGRLSADNVDVYLVQARAGDLLNAQLDRVRVEAASVRVVQTAGNRMLSAAGPAGSEARRLWAGRVPETGEYRVEVVRRGEYCDPPANYLLKVSLE